MKKTQWKAIWAEKKIKLSTKMQKQKLGEYKTDLHRPPLARDSLRDIRTE